MRLEETSVRSALLARLHASTDGLVIEELGVEHGHARVDVAVVADRLCGYEIKSDFDTLDRLARQMHSYQRVFDVMTIVTTSLFLEEVQSLLPSTWGVLLARPTARRGAVLSTVRRARQNPHRDGASLAALLWRDEAYAFLARETGQPVRTGAARSEIYEALAARLPLDTIRTEVLDALRARASSGLWRPQSAGKLTHSERQMVVDRVPAPCCEIA